jgi:hypothetical protein
MPPGQARMLILIGGLVLLLGYGVYVPRMLKKAEQSSDDPRKREGLKKYRESRIFRVSSSLLLLLGLGFTVWGAVLVVS